ncbi:MAG: rRNA pseudouridine synthase [Clostridia bacterium]|nr:rRNA pseudouridine synthase [Clostridia bacterium]
MRIDKFFSDLALFSRSQINKVIASNRIKVNGNIVKKSNFNVNENIDIVELDGEIIEYKKFIYCLFYKPSGYVTAVEDKRENTIYELLPDYFIRKNVMPIGRLDKDTTGLLLLTNDGELCHKLTSPKHNVEKEYTFTLAESINKKDIQLLQEGKIVLKDGTTLKPCKILMKNEVQGNIIITEGKYHQIKRMFGAVGNKIIQLKRIREGKLLLPNDLKESEYILINKEDIQ